MQYTFLTIQDIDTIFAKYDIHNISFFKVLSGGSENTNYLVIAEDAKYVLTICEEKTLSDALRLAALLRHLEQHQFETSKLASTIDNKSVTEWRGKPVLIKYFIEGEVEDFLPSHLIKLIGREIGKLHKIEVPGFLPSQLSFGKEQFKMVEKYAKGSKFESWLKEMMAYANPFFATNLPRALIHADVFGCNVILCENRSVVKIMDFEEAAYYYRVFDLGMAIIGTCAEGDTINLEKARHLLSGYLEEVELTELETKALQPFTIYAGAAMTFWRHSNFNYTRPDPKLFNHYLGLKVLTDYIEGQPDDCFIELVKKQH